MRVVDNPPQKDFMVARIDPLVHDAIQMRRRSGQKRSGPTGGPILIGKAVFHVAGKVERQILLRCRQYIHSEMP